jgi:3-methylcrotonyl-CoA carboxylase beta subunit
VNKNSGEFQKNEAEMTECVSDFRQTVGKILKGSDAVAIKRHISRGKLLARQRVDHLLGLKILE